jgi:chemotaxis protein histidine kinase CheA
MAHGALFCYVALYLMIHNFEVTMNKVLFNACMLLIASNLQAQSASSNKCCSLLEKRLGSQMTCLSSSEITKHIGLEINNNTDSKFAISQTPQNLPVANLKRTEQQNTLYQIRHAGDQDKNINLPAFRLVNRVTDVSCVAVSDHNMQMVINNMQDIDDELLTISKNKNATEQRRKVIEKIIAEHRKLDSEKQKKSENALLKKKAVAAEKKKQAALAEQKRVASIAEQKKQAALAEQKRIASAAEQKKQAALAEQKRVASAAEQKRQAALAEQKRIASAAEQKRQAALAEQKRVASAAEQKRQAALAEQKRVASATVEQKRKAVASAQRRKIMADIISKHRKLDSEKQSKKKVAAVASKKRKKAAVTKKKQVLRKSGKVCKLYIDKLNDIAPKNAREGLKIALKSRNGIILTSNRSEAGAIITGFPLYKNSQGRGYDIVGLQKTTSYSDKISYRFNSKVSYKNPAKAKEIKINFTLDLKRVDYYAQRDSSVIYFAASKRVNKSLCQKGSR